MARRTAISTLVVALAGLATFSMYRETLRFGFDYDDYHFLRPHSVEEVLATFHGPWDVRGVMVPFYRPVTVAFHGLRFELFGLNSEAQHGISLALFALATSLVVWMVWRLTLRADVSTAAGLLFLTHPAMPYSLVAWVTNQMHLLQVLVILTALLCWDNVRARRLIWWLPLLLLATVSFLIKEDGVMLLPAILTLHAIRRHIGEAGLPRAPRGFAVLAVVLIVSLLAVRLNALQGLGGYGRPTPELAWQRVWGTLYGIYRLVPPDRPWQPVASWFSTALPLIAVAGWRWISTGARLSIANGAAIAVLFSMPFVFAAKAEQVYMVGLGMALVLAGASAALLDLAGRSRAPRAVRLVVLAILAGGISSFAIVSRDIARDFEPFGPMVLQHDDIVRTWTSVPVEIHRYLASKREPGAATRLSPNPVEALTHVSFGFHGLEQSPDGVPYRWMADRRVEIQISPRARAVTIPLRHQIESFHEPTRAVIEMDGRRVDDLLLDDSRWRMSKMTLTPSIVGRVHRLHITLDHAWRPADLIPGSTDPRILGLQIGELSVR